MLVQFDVSGKNGRFSKARALFSRTSELNNAMFLKHGIEERKKTEELYRERDALNRG